MTGTCEAACSRTARVTARRSSGGKVGDLAGDDRVEQTVDAGGKSIGDPSGEAAEVDPVVVVERGLGDRDDPGQRVQLLHGLNIMAYHTMNEPVVTDGRPSREATRGA